MGPIARVGRVSSKGITGVASMAEIARVEWVTYQQRSNAPEWLPLSELGKAFPLQRRQIQTIDTVTLPRLLVGVVSLQSKRPEWVQVEVEIAYLRYSYADACEHLSLAGGRCFVFLSSYRWAKVLLQNGLVREPIPSSRAGSNATR